ncbi:MAG: hypothetical protein JWO04_533 [Gammaproteobacteria bacterium]|nr:hypothetical protein [Gammaproteobacteria bacterium]
MRQCHHQLLNGGARQPQCTRTSECVFEMEPNVLSVRYNFAGCQRGNVYLIWHVIPVRKFHHVMMRVAVLNVC